MDVKRPSLTLVLVVFMMFASLTTVYAQEGASLDASVVNYTFVKTLPDVKAYNYGRLETGATVTAVGRTADSAWIKVQTEDGTLGWVRVNAISPEGDVAELPVADVAEDQAVVTRFLNLRANQGIDSAGTMRLEQGTVVDLLATDGEWVYIQTADGDAGWASPNGLSFVRGAEMDEAAMPEVPVVNASVTGYANLRSLPEIDAPGLMRLEPGTPVTVLATASSSAGEFFQVETLDGFVAWGTARAFVYDGAPDELPVMDYNEDQAVVVNYAVLRAEPDATSAEVATLPAGTTVTLLLQTGNRVLVEADGLQGWAVDSALAYPGGVAPATLQANATVAPTENVANINLRAEPSLDAAPRGVAAAGDRVAVIGVSTDGEWYRVVPGSHVAAWVYADLVEVDAGAGPFAVVEPEAEAVAE
jgi:uncharacterized protein YgiM (DUF1202 family)